MDPKISVVMPVYNEEKFIRECLDSVVNQTLRDIEIICVNDGSTDSTLSILNDYAQKDPRIKVIDQPNQGSGIARNTGLEIARGEYLAILDSDDRYDLSMLEKLLRLAEKDDLDIAICRCQALDNKTGEISEMSWAVQESMLPENPVFSYKDLSRYNFRFCIGWSWDKIFRRSFVEKHGIRFPHLRNTEDAYFVFIALVLADRMGVLDEVLVTHRMSMGTGVSETRDKNPDCFIQSILGIRKVLEEKNRFAEVEQGFSLWCAEHTVWQLSTLKLSSKIAIRKELLKMLEDIKLPGRPSSYFDNRQDEQLKETLQGLEKDIAKADKYRRRIRKYQLLQKITLGILPYFRRREEKYRRKLQDLLDSH